MVRGFLFLALGCVASAMIPTRVSAWNDTGHRIVALLAYQSLDDATQKKIQAILKEHPHYDEYLAKKSASGKVDLDQIAMNAATWSDWIRSKHTKQFHKGTWHYINQPYIVLPAEDVETRKKIEAAFADTTINRGDILRIIPECLEILKKPAQTLEQKAERAIRLAWLFHLVGDLHQPLHAVALCNEKLIDGDRGANLIWVQAKGEQGPTNLHRFWDNSLGVHDDVRGLVRDIKENVRVCADERKITNPRVWAEESFRLAKSHAYNFRGKAISYVIDKTRFGPRSAPALPDGYHILNEEIARQRVALAGARLADLVAAALAEK